MLSSSFSLWRSFDSVKGTNTFLWTCLGLSLIVSLTVFVLMFLLRKMSSEPLKDKLKNTGWFDGWSLKSLSKRWLLWISIPFLLSCCVSHPVSALLSMLHDSWVKWTWEKGASFPMFTPSLLISYHVSLPQHSSSGIYSFEVLRPLWETSISLTKVSTLIKHHTIRNS